MFSAVSFLSMTARHCDVTVGSDFSVVGGFHEDGPQRETGLTSSRLKSVFDGDL